MQKTMLCSLYLVPLFISLATSTEIKTLEQGENIEVSPYGRPTFKIFCYRGRPKYLIHIWQSVFLSLNHPSDDYNLYEGGTAEDVQKEFNEDRYSWHFNLFSWRKKQIKLDPFNQSCIGISTSAPYSVSLNVIRIDYWKVILFALGLFMFFTADRLSKNTMFYYLCGISLGICTSFIVLIYLFSKLFPKKPVMYGVALCGWTVGLYLVQLIWDNIRVILTTYRTYVIWYTIVTGFISFTICYRWGPIENQKTQNLIRWTLQIASLLAIFYSTQFQEAAMGQIMVLLLFHNVPSTWLSKPRKYWQKRFPPKVKLLSNDDYYRQGVQETSKSLEELRKFCSSPDCKQWQLALKLKDVKRFASFIEGNSHLKDEEILDYETSLHTTDLTDDESELSEEEM